MMKILEGKVNIFTNIYPTVLVITYAIFEFLNCVIYSYNEHVHYGIL